MQPADIIFLVILVIILAVKLKGVLGSRPEGEENQPKVQIIKMPVKEQEIEKEQKAEKKDEEKTEIELKLKKIEDVCPSFDADDFMKKAPKAFEYIATSFAKGDKKALDALLSRTMYKGFCDVIDKRVENKETAEFSLIGFDKVELINAEIYGACLEMTVKFVTEQTNIIKNEAGEIIEGDPTYIETVTDVWTFRREMKSASPTWILIKTQQQ
ncbi:MAG: Tim44/TimA family putative adaptor protein [Alphaproteobacteria bacterium]|nr:Tim44/TimA family putative adaptor protein [Alphaproteobacteria bacterium]